MNIDNINLDTWYQNRFLKDHIPNHFTMTRTIVTSDNLNGYLKSYMDVFIGSKCRTMMKWILCLTIKNHLHLKIQKKQFNLNSLGLNFKNG